MFLSAYYILSPVLFLGDFVINSWATLRWLMDTCENEDSFVNFQYFV